MSTVINAALQLTGYAVLAFMAVLAALRALRWISEYLANAAALEATGPRLATSKARYLPATQDQKRSEIRQGLDRRRLAPEPVSKELRMEVKS